MPINEFAGGLSWGYNLLLRLRGGRSVRRTSRPPTFVNAHERGIAVLLDAVYNHLGPSDLGIWR